ncbi:MAG: RDD family protein [Bacteroidota bacterium]
MDLAFEIRTAQNVPLALEPAGIGLRLLATVVDALIGFAWVFLFAQFMEGTGAESITLFLLLGVLPAAFYHVGMEVLFEGRSLGKLLFRTRVARLDGAQPTLSQYLLRWLFRFVDITFTFGIPALISCAVTSRQQRLGDLVAGTTVVRHRRRLELNQVLYPQVPEGYEPVYPQAEALSDAEVRTVRAVIARLALSNRDPRSRALANRAKRAVEKRLDLGEVSMQPEPFLRTIVRDHVAQLDRLGT